MPWFLDFVGYQDQEFIIKEIAILHNGGDRCYNYFITGPRKQLDSSTIFHQYQMHKLRWDWGDYEFNEVMMDIARKLREDTVYIKGKEKFEFMKRILPRPNFVELEGIPSFKELNNCVFERCEVRHGNHCARRKVYELKHFSDNSPNYFINLNI